MQKAVTWRLDDTLLSDIYKIAEEQQQSVTSCISDALKLYRDSYYMENKAVAINSSYLSATKGMVDLMEHRINNRSNQLLSSLAIQQFVICKVLAESLEVSPDALEYYRKQAIEFMRENNRVFKLKEMLE